MISLMIDFILKYFLKALLNENFRVANVKPKKKPNL